MTPTLEELRFQNEADVYKAGRLAARLSRTSESVDFTYDSSCLQAGHPAVATSLPLSAEPRRTHAPGALPTFFAGLLPGGRRVLPLRRALKAAPDDDFTLLLAVGSDAIGDVQVVPAGEEPVETESRVSAVSWSEVHFERLYAEAAGQDEFDRIALPGVQEKISARMLSLPVARADARFILKLNPPELPYLVENEAFFLQAARESGMDTAESELVLDADGVAGLLVRRFDRVAAPEGGLLSLAQEDGCQVLGRYPEEKYSVSSEELIAALANITRARPVAARALLRQLAFAYLSCNGDAHAKNLSVLRAPDGEWRASPMYDIPSSHPYGDHTMSLTVAGRMREDIGREDFIALGEKVGVRRRVTEKVLAQLVEASAAWRDRLDELPFDGKRIHDLRKAVDVRRKRLGAR